MLPCVGLTVVCDSCCYSETAEKEQLAQLQILRKAQQRQIEDLEQKLEDSRRNLRYQEHQSAIAKGNGFTYGFASREQQHNRFN